MNSCAHIVTSLASHLSRPLREELKTVRPSAGASTSTPTRQIVTDAKTDDPFARLVDLVKSNDRLMAELKTLDGQLREAKDYLAEQRGSLLLGTAQLDRVRDRRSRVLAALRSNRIAAREFLATSVS